MAKVAHVHIQVPINLVRQVLAAPPHHKKPVSSCCRRVTGGSIEAW